jgi:hypothetical protein
MLYLKLMSAQDLPDSHPSHDFELIQLASSEDLAFVSTWSEPFECEPPPSAKRVVSAVICSADGERRQIELSGNAYVLNEQGKTLASRSAY